MTQKELSELEQVLVLCKKHHVLAVEVGDVKVQFHPGPFDPSAMVPPPIVEEPPKRPEVPVTEAVIAALHLGGGRG